MHLLPMLLIAGSPGNWAAPLVPVVRAFLWLSWPIQRIHRSSHLPCCGFPRRSRAPAAKEQQAIEALVDAATEEGIIEQDDARLIEQVVEFGDKRVREVMTPRPDVIAISARATLEELRERVVETKFSRLPVYEKSLDDIVGIAMARDMLEVPDRDAAHRTVREIDAAGAFCARDEIRLRVAEGNAAKEPADGHRDRRIWPGRWRGDRRRPGRGDRGRNWRGRPTVRCRTWSAKLAARWFCAGSVPVDKLGEIFGRATRSGGEHSNATTVAGLLNGVAGHVPRTGEIIEFDGLRFEVLEANQRKVLRVRGRRAAAESAISAHSV